MSDNIITKGLRRLVTQFKQSILFNDFIESFLSSIQSVYDSLQDLLNNRSINTAEGIQLDGIGEILGLERPKVQAGVLGAFGFYGDDTADGFSSLTYPESGGNLTSLSVTTVPMVDAQYRIALKAQAFFNSSKMTVNETLNAISYLTQARVKYFLTTNLEPLYVVEKELTTYEMWQLENLPALLGIVQPQFDTTTDLDTYVP